MDAVEPFAFDPMLKLAGLIAGIGAAFEHGDDNDFDLNRRLRDGQ